MLIHLYDPVQAVMVSVEGRGNISQPRSNWLVTAMGLMHEAIHEQMLFLFISRIFSYFFPPILTKSHLEKIKRMLLHEAQCFTKSQHNSTTYCCAGASVVMGDRWGGCPLAIVLKASPSTESPRTLMVIKATWNDVAEVAGQKQKQVRNYKKKKSMRVTYGWVLGENMKTNKELILITSIDCAVEAWSNSVPQSSIVVKKHINVPESIRPVAVSVQYRPIFTPPLFVHTQPSSIKEHKATPACHFIQHAGTAEPNQAETVHISNAELCNTCNFKTHLYDCL